MLFCNPLVAVLPKNLLPKIMGYGGFFSGLLLLMVYFSTSLAIVFSVIVGVLWLLSGQFVSLPKILKQYPVAMWSLTLYVCFIIGSSYGSSSHSDAFSMISKYRELFFIPILISFLSINYYRDWAWRMFVLASVLTLLGSYLMNMGVIGDKWHLLTHSFKSYITHSIFMAFFAFFCLHKTYDGKRHSGIYLVLLALTIGNIFFVVVGRTGQLIVAVLILLFAIQRFGHKGRLLTAVTIMMALTLFLNFSDKSIRIHKAVMDTQAYLDPVPKQSRSSMGQRYTFWEYSVKLIAEKPLLGHGTGSFSKEYQRFSKTKHFLIKNPHNEFLMIAVQLGALGLFVYLGFIVSQYYYARALPSPDKWLAQGVVTTLLITALFNTPFLDHTEGHWFAFMIALCFASNASHGEVV